MRTSLVTLFFALACGNTAGNSQQQTARKGLSFANTAPTSQLRRCVKPSKPQEVNAFLDERECPAGSWAWSVDVQAERASERTKSCAGPGGQSLPLIPPTTPAPLNAWWTGSDGAWALTLKQDYARFPHPCGDDTVTRVFLTRDVERSGGLLPSPETLRVEASFTYGQRSEGTSGSRLVAGFTGLWDGKRYRIELNLHSANWPDDDVSSTDVALNKTDYNGYAQYLVLDASQMPATGAVTLGTSILASVDWNVILTSLASRNILVAPAAGWSTANTLAVSFGAEVANGLPALTSTNTLDIGSFVASGMFNVDICAATTAQEIGACDMLGRRCTKTPASPSGAAWSNDATCTSMPGGGIPGSGGGAAGAGGGAPGPGSGGGASGSGGGNGAGGGGAADPSVEACGSQAAERNACSPSTALRRCAPSASSPTQFAWKYDAQCTFPVCSGSAAERYNCHPTEAKKRCSTEPTSATGFAWKPDDTCALTACGGTSAAQKGQCHPVEAQKRCAAEASSSTGYAWKPDAACQPLRQCGAQTLAQQNQCSPSVQYERCATNALSPTGYAWTQDNSCVFQACAGTNPAQKGQCHPVETQKRCAAEPTSSTGFAWKFDANCVPTPLVRQCGETNPAQKGNCSPVNEFERCSVNGNSPTGYAWTQDNSCTFVQCGAANPAQRGQCHPVERQKRCAVRNSSPSGYAWTFDSSCP
jgi:hypothetical protein